MKKKVPKESKEDLSSEVFSGPKRTGPMQVLATWRNTEMKDMATSVLLCQGFVTSNDVHVEVINGGKTL